MTEWVKSSFCDGGSCVEAAEEAEAGCNGGECVEVAHGDDGNIYLRSSQGGPVLQFTPDEWDAFVAGAKAGEFNFGMTIA